MKTKIIVAGIGGVGGYFGGLLANGYHQNENIEISFVARGKHLKEIKKNGLKVIKADTEFIAKPTIATDNPSEIGTADFIIISTKSYDLETVVRQLMPCVDEHTIILPLLNGVDSKRKIEHLLPNNLVLEGCVYIVSRLKEPGVIENMGNIESLFFGLDQYESNQLNTLEQILKEANVNVTQSKNISTIIWEKYIFISAIASATSYYDKCVGELLLDTTCVSTIQSLIEEVNGLAKAKNISISEDMMEKCMQRIKALPFDTTSSMHSDYRNGKTHTELDSLTLYVIREREKLGLESPAYQAISARLSNAK